MTEKRWIRRSLRKLSQALHERGFAISHMTIRRLLVETHFSLKANRKALTTHHAERDRQFRYIERVKKCFLAAGYPVVSVDTKKKELIGAFKNAGQTWCHEAELVNMHDFPQDAIGRAVPYGLYDLKHNLGHVYVGMSADTAEFAIDAIVHWWNDADRPRFAKEDKLLILCDAGGSNSCRSRLWKQQLQEKLADHLGIEVMVCHYPTGASKWNPIEHRLFSYISLNWAGKPLHTFDTLLNYLRGTTTETGLKVKATLIEQLYQTGIKVSQQDMAQLNLLPRRVCPQWNYIIRPHAASP
jgi:hypothetical protein